MAFFVVGAALLAFAFVLRRFGASADSPGVPPASRALATGRKRAAPGVAVIGVIALIAGVASFTRGGDEGDGQQVRAGSAERATGSLDRCDARLHADVLLGSALTPPFDDHIDEDLRALVPPAGLQSSWDAVIAVVAASGREGVSPDAVSDHALSQRAVDGLKRYDNYVVTTPCDPTGLPADFGCESIEPCMRELLGSGDHLVGPVSVKAALLGRSWKVDDCVADPGGLCELSAKGGAEASVWFGRTTTGRLVAWRTELRQTSN